MGIAYFTHTLCKEENAISYPPEYPSRLNCIEDHLVQTGILPLLIPIEPPDASIQQLSLVHTDGHISQVLSCSELDQAQRLSIDVIVTKDTVAASLKAAGAGIAAVDTVMTTAHHKAYCNIRPPGHHATRDNAMGFCVFNNIAIAASYALKQYDLQRIAIIDFDVHHGNGTEEIFSDNDRVRYFSSFQHPLYPFTDIEHYADNIIKMPLQDGANSGDFKEAYESQCFPLLDTYKPEILFISAGFDAHQLDPLSSTELIAQDYYWISKKLNTIAQMYSQGRIVSLLEGGYHPVALAQSVSAHLKGLM